MISSVKNILFATNLTQGCMPAFEFAAVLATRFQATMVMLHVVEKMPDYVEKRLVGLLGKKQWEETFSAQVDGARQKLIGKRSANAMVSAALEQFCTNAGIDDDSCGYHSREIVVTDGEIVDDIVSCAKEYECDLIVMGVKGGLLANNTIGSVTKGVIRRTEIPVMVVPPDKSKKA